MKKILFVDDNLEYANNLSEKLIEQGYDVTYIIDPINAIEEIAVRNFDLVISDYKMHMMDGVRLLATLKRLKPNIKCMLLTGFPTEEVELEALDIYVDKYLSKDKSLKILCKHIEILLSNTESNLIDNGRKLISKEENIIMDVTAHTVCKNNEEIILTRKEYDLLRLFLENKGVAFSREQIVEKLWLKELEEVDVRIVDSHIKKLRDKLKTFAIMAIRGYGYKWSE